MPFYRCVKRYYFRRRKWKEGQILNSSTTVKDKHFLEISEKAAMAPTEPSVNQLPQSMSDLANVRPAPSPRIISPREIASIKPENVVPEGPARVIEVNE